MYFTKSIRRFHFNYNAAVITLSIFFFSLSIGLKAQSNPINEFYISPAGSDKNTGSISSPLASIEKARDLIRESNVNSPGMKYTVYMRSGIYHIRNTIEFNKKDTYRNGAPVIFRAYNNEKVRISGGIEIPRDRIGDVKDPEISKRLINDAKANIRMLSYAGLDINEGKIPPRGFGRPFMLAQMELFSSENAYYLAKWPNSGYVPYTKVINPGSYPCDGDYSNKGGVLEYDILRVNNWKNADEPWLYGYFHYGWADDAVPVTNIDTVKHQIALGEATHYGYQAGEKFNSFFAFNLLEEIDQPGEYFADKKNKIIYFYPYDGENLSDLSLSLMEKPMLAIEDASNIYFENIIFECTRGMGVYIEGGHDIHFDSCIFRNIGTVAICIGKGVSTDKEGKRIPASRTLGNLKEYMYSNPLWDRNSGTNHLISNCEIYNIGAGGIILGGGNRITLQKGNNKVTNCSIHNFNRNEKTYRGAISLDGVGNTISHCEIYDCPAIAIPLFGNNHLIEYNVIHDACTEGNDMGAFYYGRNPSEQGNILRYNYFHHLGNKDGMIMAVYHDDGACGMEVYGNIFYKAGSIAVMIGGGNDIHYKNNIFIDIPLAFHIDNRLQNWAKDVLEEKGIIRSRLNEIGIERPPYSEAYPNLAKYWNDNAGLPKRNVIEGNVFFRVKQIQDGHPEWSSFINNYLTNSDPGFADYSKSDFNLRDDSKVFKEIPGFEKIPFNKIGRIK